jgi:hypothetical protein
MALPKRYSAAVVAVSLLVITAAGAVAGEGTSTPPGTDDPQITAIEPAAKEALEVLDEHRGVEDALPEDVSDDMDEAADFGMNPDLSRLSIGNATHSVYVIPARERVCASLTVGLGANVICPSTDDIARGESAPATVGVAEGTAIYGIVPDGVESVLLHTGTSDSTVLLTDDNAYYTVVPAGTPLRKVSYVGLSGSVDFPIYDSALIFERAGTPPQ